MGDINLLVVVMGAPQVATIYEKILHNSEYRIRVARKGPEAVEKALSIIPQAIVMDLAIPTGEEFKTLEFLHKMKRTADTPVLLVTEEASRKLLLRAATLGVGAVLAKPFKNDLFLEKLNSLLQGSTAREMAEQAPSPEEGDNPDLDGYFKFLHEVFHFIVQKVEDRDASVLAAGLEKIGEKCRGFGWDAVQQNLQELQKAAQEGNWNRSILLTEELFFAFNKIRTDLLAGAS